VEEIEVLFDVICARLAMRALIWHGRGSDGDARLASRLGDTFDLLALWLDHGPHRSTQSFHAACAAMP